MKVVVFDKVNKKVYNAKVNHPLQTFEWGEFRESNGVKVVRFGVWEKEKLVSAFQVFFHPLPKTKLTVGYFPRGEKITKLMLTEIKKVAQENKAIFVKVEPNLIFKTWENKKGKVGPENFKEEKFDFKKLGLVKSAKNILDPHTFILDLKKTESELMESFHSKTRYNIRLADRKGVKISEESTPTGLAIFTKLLFDETVKRQGFYMHSPEYFKRLWDNLSPSGVAKILLAKHKGNVLAAWMLFVWGDTLHYPYGASSSSHRNLMASNLVCWEAIKIGKKLGCKQFDLWGGCPADATPAHRYYGFHRFKLGYGGDLVEMVGPWDLVVNKPLYHLYNLVEKLRWKILRLKKKVIPS